ncbi:MAG: ankyrin repeat domain-containing protein [Gammaproteobacteria bacterium]|nr:ankyrin repeat domain-containing protein [Gammaproteobacteria bacterium]
MHRIASLIPREDVNQIDEYGFTPLIEAAIIDHTKISAFLLDQGADPNRPDVTGGTALQWAVENNNQDLCRLLLNHGADPNAYNLAGQPVLVMPILRKQKALQKLLVKASADEVFAQDYINVKLLGHLFELVGTANIVDPQNHYVEVDFEGFYLEVTLGLISDSLSQFQNHFAARQLRRFSGLSQYIVAVIQRAAELIRYQQYRVDISKYEQRIDSLIQQEPLLIPVGYEGHAITFIKLGEIWVKCDRREDSRLYDNIVFYQINRPQNYNIDFVKNLIYKKQSSHYINTELDQVLGLTPITELKIEAQVSGNCSWANVEASIPSLFYLILNQLNQHNPANNHYKTLALNFFHQFREWNKDRALHYCIRSFEQGDAIRKACKAEILAAILFQRCDFHTAKARPRIETILKVLMGSPYEYILKNYVRIYYYQAPTEEGKQFAELLKEYGLT